MKGRYCFDSLGTLALLIWTGHSTLLVIEFAFDFLEFVSAAYFRFCLYLRVV